MPIIDSGESGDNWAIVMPRAERSLRDYLTGTSGPLGVKEAVAVLADVAAALSDLDGRVVHRDLKPENVLLLAGHWCLADFGISPYAEATTAPDTRKYSLTPEYAAPERWRAERATTSTDVYSLGILAHELLAGSARPSPPTHRAAVYYRKFALERGYGPGFRGNLALCSECHFPRNRSGYVGRSHSLWFCDAQETGRYQWFETAFMISPLIPRMSEEDPFALNPGGDAAQAVGR